MKKGYTRKRYEPKTRINDGIKSSEVRVVGVNGENIGVLPTREAVKLAEEAGLDLVEISPHAKPPVAKIVDYGKHQYEQKKKRKEIKANSHTTETKNVQIKIGTGEHDLTLKAKRGSAWLKEGHRVKVELYLRGRSRFLDKKFLQERIDRFLHLLTEEYKIASELKKGPKGLFMILERK